MNLWEIQPYVTGLLEAYAPLAGVPVIADDGTYPATPDREQHLATKGVVLIVWQLESEGLVDTSRSGVFAHDIYVPIVIEENVEVCRAVSGVNIQAEKALQYVFEAVVGRPTPGAPNESLVPMDPPFQNFGKVNGITRMVANFSLRRHDKGK